MQAHEEAAYWLRIVHERQMSAAEAKRQYRKALMRAIAEEGELLDV
jgi:hypothetical protein